jgi:RNA polymerase sigma-70 factor (ECF subfamily)
VHDSGWVKRILKGDRDAGERLVTENYPRLYRMLRYLTGSAEVAEDLTQQTFVQAWEGLPAFRGASRLSTWLHRIAYHEYTHWLRARREHAPLDAAMNVPDPRALRDWESLVLPRALAQLSEEQRDAFILYHVQGLSIAEVAAVLEVPGGTVKSRLFAARQRLRALLEPDLDCPKRPGVQSAPLPF